MFIDLKNILIKYGLLAETELKNMPRSDCDKSNIVVLNFLDIKQKIYNLIRDNNIPTSINGNFFSSNNQLYFLQTEKNNAIGNSIDVDGIFNEKLYKKIEGSIETISTIIVYSGLYDSFESFFFAIPSRKKIDVFIITNISEHQYLKLTFESLDKRRLSNHKFIRDVVLMPCSAFERGFGESA